MRLCSVADNQVFALNVFFCNRIHHKWFQVLNHNHFYMIDFPWFLAGLGNTNFLTISHNNNFCFLPTVWSLLQTAVFATFTRPFLLPASWTNMFFFFMKFTKFCHTGNFISGILRNNTKIQNFTGLDYIIMDLIADYHCTISLFLQEDYACAKYEIFFPPHTVLWHVHQEYIQDLHRLLQRE